MNPRVKICGLTNLVDAQTALDEGADLLGFIFHPKSPRFVKPEQVKTILEGLQQPARIIHYVGVFVNHTAQEVLQIQEFCGLDLAQLHGEEPPELLKELAAFSGKAQPLRAAYKAIRPRSEVEALELATQYMPPANRKVDDLPDMLIDAYHPHERGGTGMTGDWETAARLAKQVKLLLAGGLTPENVQKAVLTVRPWGVDVSSGVEISPGKKDSGALRAFIKSAKCLED